MIEGGREEIWEQGGGKGECRPYHVVLHASFFFLPHVASTKARKFTGGLLRPKVLALILPKVLGLVFQCIDNGIARHQLQAKSAPGARITADHRGGIPGGSRSNVSRVSFTALCAASSSIECL